MTAQSILVVEDERSAAEYLRLLLEERGFAVSLAANGVEALLALENEVLQALLRNRQSLTAAMDAMRMHDACDGIYDLLRAGLAMRRA